MQRTVLITGDGSPTIAMPDMQLTYHSRYGAIQESRHVFIQSGLQPLLQKYKPLTVFEMGFGTGLNALLTLQLAMAHQQAVYYHAIDLYPLQPAEAAQLSYPTILPEADFTQLHNCNWNEPVKISNYFTLWKCQSSVQDFSSTVLFKLIYYDAFAPSAQPELWTKEMFEVVQHVG